MEEEFAGLRIHLVIHEPHGNLGYLGREFFYFDSIKPVDIEFQQFTNIKYLLILLQGFDDLQFKQSHFTI